MGKSRQGSAELGMLSWEVQDLAQPKAFANLVYATGKRHSAGAWEAPKASYLMLKKDISSCRLYMRHS